MNKIHKDIIRDNYLQLSQAIRGDIKTLVKKLFQLRIISYTMEEDIMCERTDTERAYKLMDLITTRGPRAFPALYEATKACQLFDAADILSPSDSPHEPSDLQYVEIVRSTASKPLPDKWPTEEHMDAVSQGKLKVEKIISNKMKNFFNNPIEGDVYKMNSEKKGRVLIINNVIFSNMDNRVGSHMDKKGLDCVFQELAFDVKAFTDKTKDEMTKILKAECASDHSKMSCFILILLSHGTRGKVFGTDGVGGRMFNTNKALEKTDAMLDSQLENYIEIEEIKNWFCKVTSLIGKPKLFFIQACQGTEPVKGIEMRSSSVSDQSQIQQASSEAAVPQSAQTENLKEMPATLGVNIRTGLPGELEKSTDAMETENQYPSSEDIDLSSSDHPVMFGDDSADASDPRTVPEKQDVFTSFATTEGNLSFRNTAFGSWFIQALIYVLANHAHTDELQTLLRKVNQLVTRARSKNNSMQVCENRTTLLKDFYFFPGLPEES